MFPFVQALGPNIFCLLQQSPNKRFSEATSYKLASQLILRLWNLHRMGFIHNDVKLENLVVGHEDSNKLYLIDYGLASRFWDQQTD